MKQTFLANFLACVFMACSCSENNNRADIVDLPEQYSTYTNPVFTSSMPDPTIIRGRDGNFYLYATEDTRNVPISKSNNLVSWEIVTTAFTDTTRPTFEPNAGIWAPDINYINDQYVLYYSMSVWGGGNTCGIGVATSMSPVGPFTDLGKLFRSNEIGVHNSIDPFFIEEDGKKYLFWGSFFGIYAIELTEDGLNLKFGAEKQQIAGNAFEGVYIHKKDNYYYLFASIGSCCEGVNSSYKLVVGRSTLLMGPYTNKAEVDMMDNGYDILLNSNDRFVGNGHCSEIITDDNGTDWILYHGIDVNNNPESARVLLLDKITWEDGWPSISNGSPSLSDSLPHFE